MPHVFVFLAKYCNVYSMVLTVFAVNIVAHFGWKMKSCNTNDNKHYCMDCNNVLNVIDWDLMAHVFGFLYSWQTIAMFSLWY